MNRHRLLVTALAAVMILSALAPLGTVAADSDVKDDRNLTVDVDETVVTVELDTDSVETPVENATVEVTVTDENASYDPDEEYTTDENGTVELPEPEETVNVTVNASYDNLTDEVDATLEPVEDEDDEEDDEDEEENEDEENEDEEDEDDERENEGETENFGALVSNFVEEEKSDWEESDGPFGLAVAGFIFESEQHPGNAPEHAGPPGHAGPPSDGTQSPAPHADSPDDGNETDAGSTPEHAVNVDDDDDDDDAESEDGDGGSPTQVGGQD